MVKEDFDVLYAKSIKPAIDRLIDNTNAASNGFKIRSEYPKYQIYEEYQAHKTLFRVMIGLNVPKKENSSQIHRHKVCACMTAAIMKCRPIIVNNFPDDLEISLVNQPMFNEQLALVVGLSLLRALILGDAKESDRREHFEGVDFYLPDAFTYDINGLDEDQDTFTRLIWSFFQANVTSGLSMPLLADIYFLLD